MAEGTGDTTGAVSNRRRRAAWAAYPRSVGEDSSDTIAPRSRPPLKFFLLVFALSIPFWLIGAVTEFLEREA